MVAIVRQFDLYLSEFPTGEHAFGRCAVKRRHGLPSWLVYALFWLLGCVLAAAPVRVHGQSENTPALPPSSLLTPLPDVLSEGTLQPKARLWLSDRDGNQILVPEEFAEDYFSSRGQSAGGGMSLPAVTLERVEVDAQIDGDVARITGKFSIALAQDYASPVNLAFGSVQLNQSSFSGESSQNRLLAVRDDPGWRWVVRGEPQSIQTATLTGVSRVDSDQQRKSLRISLPLAPCTLRLKLPANADDLRVRNEDVLQHKQSAEGSVEVEVSCRGGEFLLSWRERAEVPQVAAIIASSSTRFEVVDPTQPWLATTTLKIRWHGRDAANQLRIELPTGGQWLAPPNSDAERYMILFQDDPPNEPPAAEAVEAPQAAAVAVLENFDVSRNELLEIKLDWEWSPTLTKEESPAKEIQLQTPLVHGVDQHTGIIDCVVTSAYAVVYKEGAGAQLVHQAPLMDPFARHQLQFKFDRQTFDLRLVFRREQSLPTIRPTYVVEVDRHKLTLTMWFDCSFDTNQPQMEIGLMLDEWVIQENTARMTDPNDLFSTAGEVLQVRQQVDRNYVIRSATGPSTNYAGARHVDQVWRVVAERTWSAEDHELYFQVPRIIRGRVNGNPEIDHGSGAMLVTSKSNVMLTWQEAAGTGLQRDSFSTEYQRFVSDAEQSIRKPMVYRFQSSETTPRWAGRAELLPRQVTLEQQIAVDATATQVRVVQDVNLQVANEALGELRFAVRKDVADSQPPQVLINGQLVSAPMVTMLSEAELERLLRPDDNDLSQTNGGNTAAGLSPANPKTVWQTYQTRNAPQILGATQVEIRTGLNWKRVETSTGVGPSDTEENTSKTSAAETTRVDVPLAQLILPAGSRHARQAFTLSSDPHVDAVVAAGTIPTSETSASGLRLGALEQGQKSLALELRPRRMLGVAPVRIEMSWLQTFVNSQKRRERFVARVESNSNELQLKLPRAANIREGLVNVSVNGVIQRYRYDQPSDIVTIPLADGPNKPHVVEVSYFLPDSLAWISVLQVSPPEIVGAEQTEQFYWQLLTPAVQHLGWSPRELTAEWTWQWGGLCWKRTSQLTQRQLEELIGARPQEPPPASANSYVMSGRGVSGSPTAWVLSRFILWFPVGLVSIAISFTALNFSVVRKPVVVFTLAVGVIGLAMIWPDLATLAGQTALLSMGLVALVWVLQAAVDSRVRRRSVFSARPSTYVDRSDHLTVARSGRPVSVVHSHGSSTGTGGG